MRRLYLYFSLILPVLLAHLSLSSMAQSPETSDIPGRLAIIGRDFNVYTHHFGREETRQLTEDASNLRRYQWPTWSPDGRLAYFCCDLQYAQSYNTAAYMSDGTQPGQVIYGGVAQQIIYAFWSPNNCDTGACSELAMLVNDVLNGTLSLELTQQTGQGTTTRSIVSGSPLYYSWSPEGDQLLFHRNNRIIDVYNTLSNEFRLPAERTSSGNYQAPAWSPADSRLLVGLNGTDAGTTDLVIIADDNEIQPVATGIRGMLSFAWSPDGRYIAYRSTTQAELGALFVVDSSTGQIISRSATNGVVAFFWSPNSQKIAYLTLTRLPGSESTDNFSHHTISYQTDFPGLAWSTITLETGLNRSYSSFLPTQEMLYLLVYFDQFAQSHRVWSPDSRYLVYTDVSPPQPGQSFVRILDVSQSNTVPVVVAEGRFAVWSF